MSPDLVAEAIAFFMKEKMLKSGAVVVVGSTFSGTLKTGTPGTDNYSNRIGLNVEVQIQLP